MSTRRAGNMAIRYRAASHRGHDQIVQLLLEAGADINAQCGCHGSALQVAIVKGHGQIVERLLERGPDVNAPADPTTMLCRRLKLMAMNKSSSC
jgi:ankyrin repeat protein